MKMVKFLIHRMKIIAHISFSFTAHLPHLCYTLLYKTLAPPDDGADILNGRYETFLVSCGPLNIAQGRGVTSPALLRLAGLAVRLLLLLLQQGAIEFAPVLEVPRLVQQLVGDIAKPG